MAVGPYCFLSLFLIHYLYINSFTQKKYIFILLHVVFASESSSIGSFHTLQAAHERDNIRTYCRKFTDDFSWYELKAQRTLWCGPGALTEDYIELGPQQTTDTCCRQHDFCPEVMEPGESKYGLTNNAAYYKLHCDCDEKFLQCLKADSSDTSYIISFIYFDAIATECFREDYPIIKCASFKDLMNTRCEVYELNTTAPKLYQFFDVSIL